MMPAAKHGDPQVGIDIHLCLVPCPAPTPTPLPTPHLSVVFDPFDYIPFIGATVTVCGMKRATAGTNATVMHIPPGFPFAPKPPEKDDELFMGSATVVADGDPMSHISHPVLSCQVAGMASPLRPRKKGGPKAMVLPTVCNIAIPSTVFLGGPPTISLMGAATKGVFAGLGKLAKSGVFRRMRRKLFSNMKPGFLKCTILRAEPVNILDGSVSLEQQDFSLPGRLAIDWVRSYASSAAGHVGLCGAGWQTPCDIRLEVGADASVLVHGPQLGPLSFDRLPAAPGEAGVELELAEGARLSDEGDFWQVRARDDRLYHFPRRLAAQSGQERQTVPIGRIADRCGNTLDFEYRASRPVAIHESAGRRLALTLEGERLAAVTLVDPASGTKHTFVRYEYDAAGDLTAVVDALGNFYHFAYDDHRMVRHTDRNGLSFHYGYDARSRVAHAWGDGGLYDYRFEYLDALDERRITDSLGHVSIVKLDERGLPISEIDPLGGMTVYAYDDAGRTTAVVDPGGRRTGYAYDERGNLLVLTRPDATVLVTSFDADDKATAIADANGATWRQRWDERGLLVEQTSPLGHVSRYDYDAYGQLVACTNPRGARTELRHDAAGRLARITDALGHATLFAHDPLGNLIAKGDALDRRTRYRYDAKGRLVAVELPSGSSVECGYDAEDNLTRYTDENGAVTQLEYFGQGEVARRLQPDGHAVDYLYDTEERLTGVRNQRGEVYRLVRDALGRVVEEIDYWGQPRRYAYDGSGYLVEQPGPARPAHSLRVRRARAHREEELRRPGGRRRPLRRDLRLRRQRQPRRDGEPARARHAQLRRRGANDRGSAGPHRRPELRGEKRLRRNGQPHKAGHRKQRRAGPRRRICLRPARPGDRRAHRRRRADAHAARRHGPHQPRGTRPRADAPLRVRRRRPDEGAGGGEGGTRTLRHPLRLRRCRQPDAARRQRVRHRPLCLRSDGAHHCAYRPAGAARTHLQRSGGGSAGDADSGVRPSARSAGPRRRRRLAARGRIPWCAISVRPGGKSDGEG